MDNITEIAKRIKQCGGNLYLVGGAVRDELLGIKNISYNDYVNNSYVPLNYNKINKILDEHIKKSKDFLYNAIWSENYEEK